MLRRRVAGRSSGNGSFTTYDMFFHHKCGVEYSLKEWVLEQAELISGYRTAHDQWQQGNTISGMPHHAKALILRPRHPRAFSPSVAAPRPASPLAPRELPS